MTNQITSGVCDLAGVAGHARRCNNTHITKKDINLFFDQRNWGLIIYDEVHLLPAPVFQITASLQARRRLGLTATLVREDGMENEDFALIGPKKYDVPWKEMEKQGWIAQAVCTEIRLLMTEERRMAYAVAEVRQCWPHNPMPRRFQRKATAAKKN